MEEFDGDKDVPEQTLSALVARTTEPGPLVELARYVGDITGLRLGVRVNINHLTGAITGSVLRLFKEDKEVSPELLEHGAEAVDVVLLNHVVCFRQTSA